MENAGSPLKKIPKAQAQRKGPSKTVGGANHISNLTSYPSETLRLLQQTLCAPGPRDSTETERELCLNVSHEGMAQQWPATGARALGTADLGMAQALL